MKKIIVFTCILFAATAVIHAADADLDGTPWTGFMGGGDLDVLLVESYAGELRIKSQATRWNPPYANQEGQDYGPYLFTEITGDFVATTKVTGFAGNADAPVFHNNGTLMARKPGGEVDPHNPTDPNEDIMQLGYFPTWTGHIVWSHDNNVRPEAGFTGQRWAGDDTYAIAELYPYMQLERSGDDFYFRISQDGAVWIPITEERTVEGTPLVITREDMPATLQLGLTHAMDSTNPGGFINYDFFEVTQGGSVVFSDDFSANHLYVGTQPAVGLTSGDVTVSELNETSDFINVALDNEPNANVWVRLTAAGVGDEPLWDPNDIQINGSAKGEPAVVTFTQANWDQIQVTVNAVDDDIEEGTQMLTILGEIIDPCDANPVDPTFDVGSPLRALATIAVLDNQPDFVVIESGDSTEVSENGATDDFTVALKSPPAGEVTVTLADSSDPAQVSVTPAVLTFTAADYADPQTVAVAAIDDDVSEDDPHVTTIVLTASSVADARYEGLETTVDVSIVENDCGAWGLYGPDFNEDCIIDIKDLAVYASSWLACTTPNEPGCVDMR